MLTSLFDDGCAHKKSGIAYLGESRENVYSPEQCPDGPRRFMIKHDFADNGFLVIVRFERTVLVTDTPLLSDFLVPTLLILPSFQ